MRIRIITFCLLLTGAHLVPARNVDLSTVPRRESVQLTIYNSEDLTLVREVRKVTFKKGVNPLQFSWANTLIDPTSVEIKFLTDAGRLDLLDTTFPHDKPQMLYWNVQSQLDGEATVGITYFTSGISWSADYDVIADKDEKTVSLDNFVRVYNRSGEEYEDAQVRLVVGKINLVEKIAHLAQVAIDRANELAERDRRRKEELKKTLADADAELAIPESSAATGLGPRSGFFGMAGKPKKIIKEGLSEYFIYTIEGTETIRDGWSKRMRSLDAKSVPLKIQYRYRPAEYGDRLVRMYLLANDKDSKLGTTPLPDGVIRVYRDNVRGGLSFLAQQPTKYIPIGDKIELNLGPDPSVVFELVKLRAWRDQIWMQLHGAEVFRRVGQPDVRIEVNSLVAGWDEHGVFSQRVRNYTSNPIDLEIRRTFPGQVIFKSRLDPTLHDFQTVQFTAGVEPGKKADLLFEIIQKHGRDQKQNNVTLEQGDVK